MLQSMNECAREGLKVKAHIIMGFPFETSRDIFHSIAYMVRMAWAGVHDCPIYIFHPYPGSVLHAQLREEGKLPAADADYDRFMALSMYSNYSNINSWSEHIASFQLRAYALAGMSIFYISQFAFRPWRIAQSVYRLGRAQPVTMLELFCDITVRRWLGMVLLRRRYAP
jgi:hypothetical protein